MNSVMEVDDELQNVFELLVARTQGEVTNQVLESAVSNMLGIQQDDDDYDDVQEEDKKEEKKKLSAKKENVQTPKDLSNQKSVTWAGPMATLQELTGDNKDGNGGGGGDADPFDAIPLGREGQKMLVTFGDGPQPKPEVVHAALLGTRRLLQIAVQDARAVRREMKGDFASAKRTITMGDKNKRNRKLKKVPTVTTGQEDADAAFLFRAMEKFDRLVYDPKCGFEIEQLQRLFPEEMNAYSRWTIMHEEYEASTKKEDEKQLETEDSTEVPQAIGGHLEDRAANFDVRTDDMDDQWYLQFAGIRRGGSFLPRRAKAASQEEKDWNQSSGRGRRRDGTWDFMSIITVRFLHWIGFDPASELPPPSEETTEALGFLGYDFMGRIVEKAIQLKLGDAPTRKIELDPGEQLEQEDIIRALNDSSIKPTPLYSGQESSGKLGAAQLYFGPGFERRVEMEMDELLEFGKKRKRLTDAELEIRKAEDVLFASLAKAPTNLDLTTTPVELESPSKQE